LLELILEEVHEADRFARTTAHHEGYGSWEVDGVLHLLELLSDALERVADHVADVESNGLLLTCPRLGQIHALLLDGAHLRGGLAYSIRCMLIDPIAAAS